MGGIQLIADYRRWDVDALRSVYGMHRRTHVDNFLASTDADRLFQHLLTSVAWRTFVVANERILGTPADAHFGERDRELLKIAAEAAENGFASIFDASRLWNEPEHDRSGDGELAKAIRLLECPETLDLLRQVTGIQSLSRVEARAVRFRVGHFEMFNSAVASADPTGKRRVSFVLNLTPVWRPEGGGLLQFRGREEHLIETVFPCFNALDIFEFPQGHWISPVSPLSGGARYDIVGHGYAA